MVPMDCLKTCFSRLTFFVLTALCLLNANMPTSSHAVGFSPDVLMLEEAGILDKVVLNQNKGEFIDLLKRNFFNGNIEGIGTLAWRLIQVAPNNADLRSLYALHLFSKGIDKDAIEQLKEAKRLDAGNHLILYAQAINNLRNKNYSNAIKTAKKSIARDKSHPFPHNVIGSAYFEQNQLNLAANSFKAAIKINPGFAPAYTNLGSVAIRQKQFKQALALFSKSLEVSPDTASPHYGLALVYDHYEKIDYALQHLQKSLEIKPHQSAALEKLAELQLKTGQYGATLRTAELLKKYGLKSADIVAAEAYLHTDQPQKALNLLKQIQPVTNHVSYLTGLGYMQTEKYKDALLQLTKVVKKNNRHAAAHLSVLSLQNYLGQKLNADTIIGVKSSDALDRLKYFMAGNILAQQGQWPQAFQSWRKASGLFHGFSLTGIILEDLQKNLKEKEFKHLIMAMTYASQRLDVSAIKQLEQALKLNPNSIWSNYFTGQAYHRSGDKQRAIEHFVASLQQAPDFLAALIAIGDMGYATQDAQLASEYYSKALNVRPNPTLIYRLGSVYDTAGELDKAETQYQRLVNDHPKSFLGYNQLAFFYAKHGIKLDNALGLAQKADQLQPNNPIILDTLGWIYFQKKNVKKAKNNLKRAIDITDQIPSILYHYGSVMRATGDREQAVLFMRKALNITDQFEGADDARGYIQEAKKRG